MACGACVTRRCCVAATTLARARSLAVGCGLVYGRRAPAGLISFHLLWNADRGCRLQDREPTSTGTSPTEVAEPEAPQLGAELTRARLRLGASAEEIGARLRIRPAYLHALEEGRVGDLPGTAYALAFLRNYAEALGLDPDAMAARFKAEAAVLARKPELEFPAPPPERGLSAGAAALVAVVLAVGAYAGWYRLSGEGRLPPETVTPVPAHLAPLADPAPPPPPAVAPPSKPQTAAAIPPSPSADHTPTMAYAAEPPAAGNASPGSAVAATPPPHLAIRASADAWLQVRQKGGPILLSRILHAGETWPVPAEPDLVLTTGNAGGTMVVVDGVPGAVLGPLGAVRRDLPLDAEAAQTPSGKSAAAPADNDVSASR